jgi:heat shock protein HslJ
MLVKMSTLYGKYNVAKFDDEAFQDGATMEFSAGENGAVRVHAHVFNTMSGQLKEKDGKLKGLVMSTMMMGSGNQMALEGALSQGFEEGIAYKVGGGKVTLSFGSHSVVLTPQ